jgi:hypothetical protein
MGTISISACLQALLNLEMRCRAIGATPRLWRHWMNVETQRNTAAKAVSLMVLTAEDLSFESLKSEHLVLTALTATAVSRRIFFEIAMGGIIVITAIERTSPRY